MEAYKTIQGEARAEYVEKKSRFIALAQHVETEEEALSFLDFAKKTYPDARHHVYAYVLRTENRVRYSDDGEPQKTAGLPVLSVIEHEALKDVICVVTRYFGGTLLGTGGLVRAYTKSTQDALLDADIVRLAPCVDISISVAYPDYGVLENYLKSSELMVLETVFLQDVSVRVRVLAQQVQAVAAGLVELTCGKASIELSDEHLQLVPQV